MKNPNGAVLAVYDITAGRELWHKEFKAPVEEQMLAVHAGKLFGFAVAASFSALELKTGRNL